ncbi:MAG: serine hydrolase [Xanthomonadales bacterium]|nr:serine hydrolase [Xanthomonadales bacterium]
MRFLSHKWIRIVFLEVAVATLPLPALCDFEWPVTTPLEANVDSQMLAEMSQRIRDGEYGAVNSFLVLRHGKLVYEEYFNGFDADELAPVFSVTKSVASALVGVAQRRGDLPGLDTTFNALFPSYANFLADNPGAGEIRFHDLLTQRHGFAWDEWTTGWDNPANPAHQMMKSPDWWAYVLSRPVTAEPDTVFRYSTGVSNLMGLAILEHTGMSAAEYALQNLFPQLEITDADIRVTGAGAPPDAQQGIFPEGFTPTGHGLWLKPRDLAKIGQLYLDRGAFQNRRLFDPSWVDLSMLRYSDSTTDPDVFSDTIGYGYQWWVTDLDTPHGPAEVYRAWGYADQYVFVIPRFDMVIVTTASNWLDNGKDMRHALAEVIADGIGMDFDPESDAGITGPWASPHRPGQGFMLEVVPSTGQVVLFWLTFDPVTGEQLWLIGPSRLHGRRTVMQLLRPVGPSFEGEGETVLEPWGDAEIIFTTCTTAQLSYRSEVHDLEGGFELFRITPNEYCTDEPTP